MKHSKTKLGVKQLGFTIVETMIVLAVTGVMFSSVALMISGKQRTTEFQTAVTDVRTRIQQLANEVASGYFPHDSDYGCRPTPSGGLVQLTATSVASGDCVFLGKVLHFYDSGTSTSDIFSAYSVVGLRSDAGTYEAARPFLVANSPGFNPIQNPDEVDVTSNSRVPYGLTAARLTYRTSAGSNVAGSFAFMQSLNQGGSIAASGGAGQFVRLVGFTNPVDTRLRNSQIAEAEGVNRLFAANRYREGGEVEICFNSGGTNQHAIIKIGANGTNLGVSSRIANGAC